MTDAILQIFASSPVQLFLILFFLSIILRSKAGLVIVNGLFGKSNNGDHQSSESSLLLKIRAINKEVLDEHEKLEMIKQDQIIELLTEIRDSLRVYKR